MKRKVIVVGGTKVDLRFGLDLLRELNVSLIPCYLSETPHEQTQLQMNVNALRSLFCKKLDDLIREDVFCIVIYCNSLSGAIGYEYLERLKRRYKMPIVTPLKIYEKMALQFRVFGVFVANGQSASHIEKLLSKHNPASAIVGFSSLNLVEAIEAGQPIEEILDRYQIVQLFQIFAKHGCEAILIGCTHFTYFMKELKQRLQKNSFSVPLIDPSEGIFKIVVDILHCG